MLGLNPSFDADSSWTVMLPAFEYLSGGGLDQVLDVLALSDFCRQNDPKFNCHC